MKPTTKPTTKPTGKPTTEPTTGDIDKPEYNGELVIIVYDEVTGDIVPGATVEVTYPDGSTKEYDTDSEGKIILTKLPAGDYEVETVKVPDGYTVTRGEKHSAVVEDGERTECDVYIAVDGVSTDDTTEATTDGNNPGNTDTNHIKTGDSFNIIIPLGVMVCAIAGAVILYMKKRKEEN